MLIFNDNNKKDNEYRDWLQDIKTQLIQSQIKA